jgi:hypothetical protein
MHIWIGALDTALQPHEADHIEAQRRKLRHAVSNDLDLVVCRPCFEFAASSIFALCRPWSLSPLKRQFYTLPNISLTQAPPLEATTSVS